MPSGQQPWPRPYLQLKGMTIPAGIGYPAAAQALGFLSQAPKPHHGR
jgi:hypothetical protein